MFKSSLDLRKLPGREMELISPLVYEGSENITVPAGFITDGASVPQAVWWFVSPFAGDHLKPAVLHDYLCVTRADQWHTDLMFLEAMEANQVGLFKRTAMYLAVAGYQIWKGKYKWISCR